MKKQREIERMVKSLLLTVLSRKTLNTGEVKQMTMRSPIGMYGIAAIQAKLAVEIVKPYRASHAYTPSFLFFVPEMSAPVSLVLHTRTPNTTTWRVPRTRATSGAANSVQDTR